MLWDFIIQRIFFIPTDSLLLVFLQYSKALREFCGFSKAPDASKITRFKQNFLMDLQSIFSLLVLLLILKLNSFISMDIFATHINSVLYNKDFFNSNPLINPKTFLGDAAFDSIQVYKNLLTGDTFGENKHFSKAYTPLNHRSQLESKDYTISEDGIPCCPHDSSLPMKPEGNTSHLRSGIKTFKFVCPKMKWVTIDGKSKRKCFCENPCTSSSCGRMIYVYPEKNLRAYPGTIRRNEEWKNIYKIRSVVEQSINHFKDNLCVAHRRTQNQKTLHADLLLAGITQLITVVLADKIQHHEYIRSIKPLIA